MTPEDREKILALGPAGILNELVEHVGEPADFEDGTVGLQIHGSLWEAIQMIAKEEVEKKFGTSNEKVEGGAPSLQPPPEPTEDWEDRPLPEDAAIKAAFPTRTGKHELYGEAMRMVSAKRSKGALVALVNWLLAALENERRGRLRETADAIRLRCEMKVLELAKEWAASPYVASDVSHRMYLAAAELVKQTLAGEKPVHCKKDECNHAGGCVCTCKMCTAARLA